MVAPIIFEVEFNCRRTFSLFTYAICKRNDFVAHKFRLDRQYAEYRPISVSVICPCRKLIYYTSQKSFELTQFFIIGKRSIEKRLVISLHKIAIQRLWTSKSVCVSIAILQRFFKILKRRLDVAIGKIASCSCADNISKSLYLTRFNLSAVRELIIKASFALKSESLAV